MTKHAFDKIMTGAREARAAIPLLSDCEAENVINALDRHCRIGEVTMKSFKVELKGYGDPVPPREPIDADKAVNISPSRLSYGPSASRWWNWAKMTEGARINVSETRKSP